MWGTQQLWGDIPTHAPSLSTVRLTPPPPVSGPAAADDWAKLETALRPLSKGVMALPSTAVRGDLGVLLTVGLKYPRAFLDVSSASSCRCPRPT